MKTLLLIEDDIIMGESLVQRFELEGFDVHWCQRLADADLALARPWTAVISDVRLTDGIATHWFIDLAAPVRAQPWFFLTGYGSVNDAIAAIRAGAREYLTKPFDIEGLVAMVHEAITPRERELDEDGAVLGVSPAMRRIEKLARKVATQKVSVLLTGESGVGKEVTAQFIHALSPACEGEFIAVNCAAIPESMMEAEVFGYEKHAFTGAQRMHRGYLERANGGTLFLDEVGELPASMQAKLLRALQERSFFRLGSERLTRSDFRIIAATNSDLQAGMAAGTFREDLYYRLAVIRINLPPLRERLEDIRWLTSRMVQELTLERGAPIAMSDAFVRDLLGREWKGNTRELRSHLEQALALSEAGILDIDPDGAPGSAVAPASASGGVEPGEGALLPLQELIANTERQHIRRALVQTGDSPGKAAQVLGISRKTLWEKMKKLRIERRSAGPADSP